MIERAPSTLPDRPLDRPCRLTRPLVLVGLMGAGKTSAARTVAAELGTEALDSDRELERELGEPLEDYFDREGESKFRLREEEVVLGLLARGDARVIALGGGSLGSERVREALAGRLGTRLAERLELWDEDLRELTDYDSELPFLAEIETELRALRTEAA